MGSEGEVDLLALLKTWSLFLCWAFLTAHSGVAPARVNAQAMKGLQQKGKNVWQFPFQCLTPTSVTVSCSFLILILSVSMGEEFSSFRSPDFFVNEWNEACHCSVSVSRLFCAPCTLFDELNSSTCLDIVTFWGWSKKRQSTQVRICILPSRLAEKKGTNSEETEAEEERQKKGKKWRKRKTQEERPHRVKAKRKQPQTNDLPFRWNLKNTEEPENDQPYQLLTPVCVWKLRTTEAKSPTLHRTSYNTTMFCRQWKGIHASVGIRVRERRPLGGFHLNFTCLRGVAAFYLSGKDGRSPREGGNFFLDFMSVPPLPGHNSNL